MEEFSCQQIELVIRVNAEEFDKEAFLADVKDIDNQETNIRMYEYGSQEKPGEQYATIFADFRAEQYYIFRVSYFNSPHDGSDLRPPYMEDCAQWLGQFFKREEVQAMLHATYLFNNKKYVPVVALPFPLTSPIKELSGSRVMGVILQFPTQFKVRNAIIQAIDKNINLQIPSMITTRLREFDLKTQLQELSAAIMMLVSPVGDAQ